MKNYFKLIFIFSFFVSNAAFAEITMDRVLPGIRKDIPNLKSSIKANFDVNNYARCTATGLLFSELQTRGEKFDDTTVLAAAFFFASAELFRDIKIKEGMKNKVFDDALSDFMKNSVNLSPKNFNENFNYCLKPFNSITEY